MQKIFNWMLAAILICGASVMTSCTSDNDDNPVPDGTTAAIAGRWTADVTGATETLWGDGKALRMTELKSNGTGSTDIYYLVNDDAAIGHSHQTFRYTATTDGQMTMTMDDGQRTETVTWTTTDGRLTLTADGEAVTLQRADDATEKRVAEWNADNTLINVPAPARYTVFVYGNAGGTMDDIIEDGLWEQLKPLLTDQRNVRVMCFYKYGQDLPEEDAPFAGKYAEPGDIVWFELTSKTDLHKLKEEGVPSQDMKLCSPSTLRMFLRYSSLLCPAENYVFTIWGHGSGFDATHDVPGKYDTASESRATRGVIDDEWNDDEQLDMYELAYAIRSVSQRHFDNIFFHNCLMGNLESITELRDVTDYITCSAHELCSDGAILVEYIRGLMDKGNTPEAIDQMFSSVGDDWKLDYLLEGSDGVEGADSYNGDLKLLRTDRIDPILAASKRLAERLVAQYPAQREAIDRATCSVYRFTTPEMFAAFTSPLFDLADYAHKVADETADAEFAAIAADLDRAFSDVFVRYEDVNWNTEQRLPHYTLSVSLVSHDTYVRDLVSDYPYLNPLCNFNVGYEQTTFHRLTGWGTWLDTNQQLPYGNPTSGGSGDDDFDFGDDDFED